MNLHVRYCYIAERDHKRSVRQYAHTLHRPHIICVARDFWTLPQGFFYGILAHEIGHIIAKRCLLSSTEDEADSCVHLSYDINIRYKDSNHGKRLEWLNGQDVRRFEREFKLTYNDYRGETQALIEDKR